LNVKEWFPFTDYDFYSYLACGLVLLFGLDYWHTGGQYLFHDNWTFFQGALTVSLAYVAGQIIAIPSSMLIEHWLARKVLRPPAVLLISGAQNKVEKFIERFLIGRHYSPLPKGVINKIFLNAEKDTGLSRAKLEANLQEIFVPALEWARGVPETRSRIDFFRNQYTFSRNMAFSGLVVTVLLIDCTIRGHKPETLSWSIFSFILSMGMLIRFLKFYSCCATEILRKYAYCERS
jgi:hypothetical protein